MPTVTGQQEMVLVPRIPTPEMLEAAWQWAHAENELETWRAMITAWERQQARELKNETLQEEEERPSSS